MAEVEVTSASGLVDRKFLLISAARDISKSGKTPFSNIKEAVQYKYGYNVTLWPLVELRLGTMDALYLVLDELIKRDPFIKSTVTRIGCQLVKLVKKENRVHMNWDINDNDIYKYTTLFYWEDARFSRRRTLAELTDKIYKDIEKIDIELKSRVAEYESVRTLIRQAKAKQTGSLLTRDVSSLIDQEDMVETEYLTSIVVVVPALSVEDWEQKYETLTEYVLPKSSKLLYRDNDHALFRVCMFKRVVDDFAREAQRNRWVVRRVESKLKSSQLDLEKLEKQKQVLKQSLSRWCSIHFSSAYVCWMHFEYIRLFVESVLRFGLPINFEMILIDLLPKSEKKIHKILQKIFNYLAVDDVDIDEFDNQVSEFKGKIGLEDEKFYPYVSIEIEWKISVDT